MIAWRQHALALADLDSQWRRWAKAALEKPEHAQDAETARLLFRDGLLALRQTIDAELASLDSAPADEPPPTAQGDVPPEKSAGLDPIEEENTNDG